MGDVWVWACQALPWRSDGLCLEKDIELWHPPFSHKEEKNGTGVFKGLWTIIICTQTSINTRGVWFVFSNNHFQFLNNISRISIYFFHPHVLSQIFLNNNFQFLNTHTKQTHSVLEDLNSIIITPTSFQNTR